VFGAAERARELRAELVVMAQKLERLAAEVENKQQC